MKDKNQFTVEFFIKKFEAIPEELWTSFTTGSDGQPRCANGHCMTTKTEVTEQTEALKNLFCTLRVHYYGNTRFANDELVRETDLNDYTSEQDYLKRYSFIADRVNNGFAREYQQPTPKQRILAALYDIKKLQEKESPTPQELPYRTVVIDSKVKSLTEKEIIYY